MQPLHKIYPETPVQQLALEELRSYYYSVHKKLLIDDLITRVVSILVAISIIGYNIFSLPHQNLDFSGRLLESSVAVLTDLLLGVILWVLLSVAAVYLITHGITKLDYKEVAENFKTRLTAVSEQYVGKTEAGDQVHLHINAQFIEGGFYGLTELRHPVLTITILRHAKTDTGYKDTGPLHLSFQDNEVQLWAGIVQKPKKSRGTKSVV